MLFPTALRSLALAVLLQLGVAAYAEPFFRAGDIVALVGGEEMVAAAEAGEMELALTGSVPELHLSFRSLAWEGDTVFEQRRDLNYPPLEEQLASMRATVVIAQFGQMECLAGLPKLPQFIAAYEKLLDRLAGPEKRRFLLIIPHEFSRPEEPGLPDLIEHNADLAAYATAIRDMAARRGLESEWTFSSNSAVTPLTRDGIHLNARGEALRAQGLTLLMTRAQIDLQRPLPARQTPEAEALLRLIRQKNRFWFNYYRPQNWAFLAGDRVNQPSSHDHLDPQKRWFPEEMAQYLPLVQQKDREIWEAAAALAKPKSAP